MKTVTTKNHFFTDYKLKINHSCEILKDCFLDFCSLLLQWFQIPVLRIQLSKSYEWMAAHLTSLRGVAVAAASQILQVLVLLREISSNKRLSSGILLALLSVPAWLCYRWFDATVRIEGLTFWVNYAFFFNSVRGYLAFFFLTTAAFITLPQKWAFRWWAVPIAIFCASEVYRMTQFVEWSDFYTDYPSWQVLLVFGVSVPALYVSANYLLYRKYHLKDGTAARIIGVVKVPNVSNDEKMKMLEKLVKESEEFNARI